MTRSIFDHTYDFVRAMQATLTRAEVADPFLGSVHNGIDAGAIGLYQIHAESGQVMDVHARVSVEFLDEYETYGRTDDPVLEYVVENQEPIDSSRLHRSAWASSGARAALRVGGYEHSMEAPLIVSGRLFGTINFARDDSRTPFSSADLSAAGIVSEHLSLAIERAHRFEQSTNRAGILENAIDRIPQAIVIADLHGRILFRNRAARREWDAPIGDDGAIGLERVCYLRTR
ncbi:GAF domain-containing protein [Rhodococcus opacus]|uniref:GAF domain-containing protein n=1 Tax=Rhodococcus opacus TaxID=37919 RepID=A0AAX3Y5A2_RHOOP|nr:GAF domain-containing protein [Rhodococcus opacus]WLF44532.1 GAF domain-containing protein [Rhodococcus opacus]